MRRRLQVGLRTRATVGFGVTGLCVAIGVAALTYALTRSYLVDERGRSAERQAYVNARLARTVLRGADPDVRGFLAGLGGGTASNSILNHRGEWFSTSVAVGPDAIPDDLVRVVADGHAGHQRFRDGTGQLQLVVGVPVAAVDGSYFEVFALDELERTLELLTRSLLIGVAGAALVAAVVGRAAAGRLLRPLSPVADAAQKIAGGALDTRLGDVGDPDLRRLSDAFDAMAAELEARLEREARFAADVTHELRSPLAAVSAAVEVIERRRHQLPQQVVEAFTVLREKLEMLRELVLDLLEISRVDAGTAALSTDLIDLGHFLPRLLAMHGAEASEVVVDDGAPTHLDGDRRRLAQAMGNIVDNARRYAGGITRVTVSAPRPGLVRFMFDDRGPGVPPGEREAIFGRFTRGTIGSAAGGTSGTGLGLSLAAEHVRLHDGRVWVEENPDGGARFVVELPTRSR